jgi:archaeosortase A (PGF-CTERM-specific)
MVSNKKESIGVASLFIVIPTLMLIVGYFIYPSELYYEPPAWLQIPMFLGLILLGIGFAIKKQGLGNIFKISGWFVFSFYWATQPAKMYITEGGDVVNAAICIIGVYILCYIAYHEWLCYVRKENVSCLNWIAGAACIAGLIYFGIERTFLAQSLIEEVARESAFVLNTIIGNAELVIEAGSPNIFLDGHYVVTIIFACTGIQSMVVFVGMIGALPKVDAKRRTIGLLVTVVPIYILNLLRNAMVAFLVGRNITDFNVAHNIISKIGALIALIVLLLIVIKIIPQILDEIMCLVDLHKRNGPIENAVKRVFGRKKQT